MEEASPGFGYSTTPAARALNGTGKRMSTGLIFFKTKLCSKFRAGTCPYITNCNFAHGMEELRKPPPGWEEYVNPPPLATPPESSRPCKSFFTEGVCPFGERCVFSHDDPRSKPASAPPPPSPSPVSTQGGGAKPSNWKTRLCNKWEITGYCPFAEKCHFAHGIAELKKFLEPNSTSDVKLLKEGLVTDPVPRPQQQQQVSSNPPSLKPWRGPREGISTVYGDWLEEDEEEDEWIISK